MAVYVMSDIHGEYDKFMQLLEKINLQDTDTLYILGDVVDRGKHPMKVLLQMMEMPNVIPIVGNHEYMAMSCLPFLMGEITEQSLKSLNSDKLDEILMWQYNGASTTIKEFRCLDESTRQSVLEYMGEFQLYAEVSVNGENYLLVHAGLGNFSPDRPLEDYDLDEFVWERTEYYRQYFDNRYIVTGHTPTQNIEDNPRAGYIYRANRNIAIDCGACFKGGRLSALCLDTGEEFYSN